MFVYIEALCSAFGQLYCVTDIFHHSHLYERNRVTFGSLRLFNVRTKAEFTNWILILLFLLNINLFFCRKNSAPACRQHRDGVRNAHWPVLWLASLMTANAMRKF